MKFLEFTGVVTEDSLTTLLLQLQKTPERKAVVIDSPGGEFTPLAGLRDTLAQADYTAVAYNQVDSAAIMLYVLGKQRLALPDATFKFHLGGVGFIENRAISVEQFEAQLAIDRELARLHGQKLLRTGEELFAADWARQDWTLSLLATRTGRDRTTFLNMRNRAALLSARQALQYGLVERIVEPEDLFGN